jgi:hypothetical protein
VVTFDLHSRVASDVASVCAHSSATHGSMYCSVDSTCSVVCSVVPPLVDKQRHAGVPGVALAAASHVDVCGISRVHAVCETAVQELTL